MCDKTSFYSHKCTDNISILAIPSDKGCSFEGKTYNLQGVNIGQVRFECNRKSDETWIPLSTDKYLTKDCPFEDLCKDYAGEVSINNGTDTTKPTITASTPGSQPTSSTQSKQNTSNSSVISTKSILIQLGVFGLVFSSLLL